MGTWVDACATDDVETEDVIRFLHADKILAIYRSPDDAFYCTDGICTHEQVDLSGGLVLDYVIECPKHSGQFDYRTEGVAGTGLRRSQDLSCEGRGRARPRRGLTHAVRSVSRPTTWQPTISCCEGGSRPSHQERQERPSLKSLDEGVGNDEHIGHRKEDHGSTARAAAR
jgi:3-phenylpropionate/trans-cinnamate dioxygenase ferredoxin subunit